MSPLNIVRLILIILRVIIGIPMIILLSRLLKRTKDDSSEESLTPKDQAEVKFFSIIVIIYIAICVLHAIVSFIASF